MTWNWDYAWSIMPALLDGVVQTVVVTFISGLLALVLGLVIATASLTLGRTTSAALRGVVEVLRGVPVLVLLYFAFYSLPTWGVTLSPFVTGVLVLGIVYGAYCSEVYRGGIQSLPRSTWDACHALGLPRLTTWVRIIIPLAIRGSFGALANYVIIIYKQTALLVAIGVPVLLSMAQTQGYASYRYLEPYTLAGVLYLALNIPTVFASRRIERRLSRGSF